jgi:hypothetical protein
VTLDEHWGRLVAVAMLGTDRRDPPDPPGVLADLVDDTVRESPSERMLAQVAATVAVRRAAVLPAAPVVAVQGPAVDDRPPCAPEAIDRWHHVTTSWPVLEDEWMLTLLATGQRLAPEIVPEVLARHRNDPIRRRRAELAAGPLAGWLVEHCPQLAPRASRSPRADPTDEQLGELPLLPIPPRLEPLLLASGVDVGAQLAGAIAAGTLVHAHRAVLVNLIARIRAAGLGDVAASLDRVDTSSPGFPMATVLADLATTRRRMLDELAT